MIVLKIVEWNDLCEFIIQTPPHAACLTADDVEQDRSLEKERLQWMLAESIKGAEKRFEIRICAI